MIPPLLALLALSATTSSIGRLLSWVLLIVLTPTVFFSWLLLSLQTTPSSPQRSASPLRSTTLTLTQMAPFVSTFWRTSGHLLWPFLRFCFLSVLCWLIQTLMILLFPRLLIFTRLIDLDMKLLPENGLESMLFK